MFLGHRSLAKKIIQTAVMHCWTAMFNLHNICLLRAFELIHMEFARYKLLSCSSENYLYAIQLKGAQGAKAWPVLWLVKLELKGSVRLKSRVKIW